MVVLATRWRRFLPYRQEMQALFEIAVTPTSNLIRIKMGGLFDARALASFRGKLADAHAQLTCMRNSHVTLCDIRQMKIQTQEMVASFAELVASRQFQSRRIAFLTGSTLARMQARRLSQRSGLELFRDEDAALDWLFEGLAQLGESVRYRRSSSDNSGDSTIMAEGLRRRSF